MDKCFACSNDAIYILPCYHKICDVCITELVCPQCCNQFKQEEVILYYNECIELEKCNKHNYEYTSICECDRLYCKDCVDMCDKSHRTYTMGYFKEQILKQMYNFRTKLNNKIKGIQCILEFIPNYEWLVKQYEDTIDTVLVDISHIDNFNKSINNLSISNIIKRKNKILGNNTVIPPIYGIDDDKLTEIINSIIDNDGNIHADEDVVLRFASKNSKLSFIKYLINNGADIHA